MDRSGWTVVTLLRSQVYTIECIDFRSILSNKKPTVHFSPIKNPEGRFSCTSGLPSWGPIDPQMVVLSCVVRILREHHSFVV